MEKDLIIKENGRALTAEIRSDIDHHTASGIRALIDKKIEERMPSVVTLDFSDVEFMDSSGIGLIIGRATLCERYGAELRVTGVSSNMMRLIALSGIARINNIYIETKNKKEEFIK